MLAGFLALVLAAAADSTTAPTDTIQVPKPAASVPDSVIAPPSDSAKRTTDSVPTSKSVAPVAVPGPVPSGPIIVPPPPPGPALPFGPVRSSSFGPAGAVVELDTSSSSGRPSTAAAVGLSLLLPGAGHRYAGFKGTEPFYHAADLLGWTALFVSWQTGRSSMSNAAEIANRYAGASLGSSPDAALLSAMRNYRSRRPVAGRHDSYDEAQVLSGRATTTEFSDDAGHDWDWGATDNPDNNAHLRQFESQYRKWRASQVALYSAAGTLAVLRLAAAMDILRLQRSSISNAGISMEASPSPDGVQAALSWNF